MGSTRVGQWPCIRTINASRFSYKDLTVHRQHSVIASTQRCKFVRERVPSFSRSLTRRPGIVSRPKSAAQTSMIIGSGEVDEGIPDAARQNLENAASACKRFGWISFWFQLVLTNVAAVIILFSMAFTAQQGPQISMYLTTFGIMTGFLSTFWSFGYIRLSRKLMAFLDADGSGTVPRIRRSDVITMLEKGAIINILGAGASMLGLQATIGLLVAKTLTTATVNPFLASNTNTWNPVLAFDVFNVQATTNTLLSHFFSLIVSLWLLRRIANRPSAARVIATQGRV